MAEERPRPIQGTVTSGLGRGKTFVTLTGYAEQFEDKLGYEPYPGTLNLDVDTSARRTITQKEATVIESWSDGDTTYGAVDCYPATIRANENKRSGHVVVPRRTDHDASTLELVAAERLRSALDIDDGNEVTVRTRNPREIERSEARNSLE